MPLNPALKKNSGRGFADVTEANRRRGEATRQRVLLLTIGGATAREIAESMGLKLSYIKGVKQQLRYDGLIGCCMQPCVLAPGGDPTRCKWYVA